MCSTGEAGGFRIHFRAEKKKEKKNGSNILMSQRRDTWSTEEKVNERLNVAMSQRCDVSTLRFLPQNHKKQKIPNLEGIEEHADWSAKNRAASTRIIGKDSVFVFFFLFS